MTNTWMNNNNEARRCAWAVAVEEGAGAAKHLGKLLDRALGTRQDAAAPGSDWRRVSAAEDGVLMRGAVHLLRRGMAVDRKQASAPFMRVTQRCSLVAAGVLLNAQVKIPAAIVRLLVMRADNVLAAAA